MATPPLHAASVPVFDRVLARLDAALTRAQDELGSQIEAALAVRPAPGMFPASQQAATAVQFTLRIAFPLAGARPPELRGPLDAPGLVTRAAEARRLIDGLDPQAFANADARIIRFQAGFADIELPGASFLHDFGLPNLYFHQAMTHVALKQAGLALGKADFDGLHAYPDGFAFG